MTFNVFKYIKLLYRLDAKVLYNDHDSDQFAFIELKSWTPRRNWIDSSNLMASKAEFTHSIKNT